MKKIFMIFFAAVLTVSFAACNDVKKADSEKPDETEVVAEVSAPEASVPVEPTPAQVKDYEKALKIITDVNSGGTKK
jgi:hypothetical protein